MLMLTPPSFLEAAGTAKESSDVVAAKAARGLFMYSKTKENAPKLRQLWASACGVPGVLRANPVAQPAKPAFHASSLPRSLFK